jgi:hypothetical protein
MRSSRRPLVVLVALFLAVGTVSAWAQPATPSAVTPRETGGRAPWFTVGVGSTTVLGDCRNCEGESGYRHDVGVALTAGLRVDARVHAGAEVFWLAGADGATGDRNRATLVLGIGQFRPWARRGFFLKGGMGMGFVRNWVYDEASDDTPSYLARGLAVTYGAGWAFRPDRRVGFQVFASQHVVTIGDITTSRFVADNVIANTWTLGGSLVFR